MENLSVLLGHYEQVGNVRNMAITRRELRWPAPRSGSFRKPQKPPSRHLRRPEALGFEADAVRALNCLGWVWLRSR